MELQNGRVGVATAVGKGQQLWSSLMLWARVQLVETTTVVTTHLASFRIVVIANATRTRGKWTNVAAVVGRVLSRILNVEKEKALLVSNFKFLKISLPDKHCH